MAQRLQGWDILYFLLMLAGAIAAGIHFVEGRIMVGMLVGSAVVIGLLIRFLMLTSDDLQTNGDTGDVSRMSGDTGAIAGARTLFGRDESGPRDSWVRSSVIAGFVATTILSGIMVLGYLSSGIFAQENGNTVGEWFYGLTHNTLTNNAFDIPLWAYSINLVAGIGWALVYAGFFEPRVSGPAWRRGIVFAIFPWILSLVVFFPIVGAGFFGVDLDAGPLPAIGNLILHLVYGVTLGIIYVIPETSGVGPSAAEQRAARWENRGLAYGLVIGLITGIVGGTILALSVNGGLENSENYVMIGAAGGVMAGALIGPFVGLDYSERNQPTPTR